MNRRKEDRAQERFNAVATWVCAAIVLGFLYFTSWEIAHP